MTEREEKLSHSTLLERVIYNEKTGKFMVRRGHPGVRKDKPLGHVGSNGYRRIMINDYRYLAHRLTWFYIHKKWPRRDLDHKNLKRDDNRITNLRETTDSQNHANMRPSKANTSGVKGVCWNRFRNYWQSYIKVNGKSFFVGRFDTLEEGRIAYEKAAKKYHGEFARVS